MRPDPVGARSSGTDPAEELLAGLATVTATLRAARRPRSRSGRADPADGAASTVPVTLLTGALGSGKTTVLRRLLAGGHGLRVTAIVNDLAAVNVDGRLLDAPGAGQSRLELTNGCACCALTDDLADALVDAASADVPPDAIVVEASGASDAVALAATVERADDVRLDGIVCVVDARAWDDQVRHPIIGPLVRRQLEAAHLVVLSKVDVAGAPAAARATASVARLAPGRQVVPAVAGAVDPALLLDAAVLGAALRPPAEPHDVGLTTDVVTVDGPVALDGLARWLETDHGLLRAKGWLRITGAGATELQVVGRRWTLTTAPADADPVVVLIGDRPAVVVDAARALRGLR